MSQDDARLRLDSVPGSPTSRIDVFVDPTCPFAWITSQWLDQVAAETDIVVRLRLMSLSALNEGRELSEWYRRYNDRAWRPARCAAALSASLDADRWPDFYRTFGARRHVSGVRDDDANLAATLAELDLPPTLLRACDDPWWDDDLRNRTQLAVAPLDTDGGTPVVHFDGAAFFGPVLDRIPQGSDAVDLWRAVRVLGATAGFAEIKRGRAERLVTS